MIWNRMINAYIFDYARVAARCIYRSENAIVIIIRYFDLASVHNS